MLGTGARRRIVIMGAAGRDFHNFNVAFRGDGSVEVVAFTAAQIPGIASRRYPPSLAGPNYPSGIAIVDERELEGLCRREKVDTVVFAYSDVAHEAVMHAASKALAVGADFALLGPQRTMLTSARPVVAVSAARTGSGKSQTARYISRYLKERGRRTAILRHPMPYGDLAAERVQRFATLRDLDRADCTLEEREEFEPHIAIGNVVYAGVDYAAILAEAEAEADILIWDGGNNDFPFIRPGLHIALVDALRGGQVATHHPGEAVVRMADVIVINKVDAAPVAAIEQATAEARRLNPRAEIVKAASPVRLDDPAAVAGRRVLVVEDGPTTTHGGMPYGAGYVAAQAAGAAVIVDPRPFLAPALRAALAAYPHIGSVVPAMGYDADQRAALAATIARAPVDVIVAGTPIDFAGVARIDKPVVRARYDYADGGEPTLARSLDDFLSSLARGARGA
jgi:predicted GTPase